MKPSAIALLVIAIAVFVAVLTLVTLIIVDYSIVNKRLKKARVGMTGHQFQNETKCKLEVISVEQPFYYAKVKSPMRFYKYMATFKNGRLKEIGKI